MTSKVNFDGGTYKIFHDLPKAMNVFNTNLYHYIGSSRMGFTIKHIVTEKIEYQSQAK